MVEVSISVALAICCTLAMLLRRSVPSPLGFMAIYYIYFSFGPALLFYTGGEIYRGTVEYWIPKALWGFSIAIFAWLVADVFFQFFPRGSSRTGRVAPLSSWTYEWALIAGTLYGVGVGSLVLLSGAGWSKADAIGAAGPLHYRYLLLMSVTLCWSPAVWKAGGLLKALVSVRGLPSSSIAC